MEHIKKFNEMNEQETNKLKCKRDLHKSTYKSNAFDKDKYYDIINEDEDFLWLKDNKNHEFNFSKKNKAPYYFIEDYFYTSI